MSQKLIAASGSDTIKLFDASAAEQGRADPCVSQFLPSPGVQVNAIRWNHTNHVLASAGEDRKISLWLKGGKLLGSVPQPDADNDNIKESILSINFSTKSSRYLCSGGTGKVVRIWDMQRKRCIKWFKGHADTITGVMYNCKDEHLASVSTRGDLIVYSLATGSCLTEAKDPFNQVLRVLEYSRLSRHMLITAGDDGSIHLWDTTTGRSPKFSWIRQHLAPITGACFSPSNDKVIVSVGFDKRLHIFDTSTKKPVNSISVDAPLSSLVVKDEGYTVAAGTNNGRIIFYDIRNKIQPLVVLRAFNPSEAVSSLCWQVSNPVTISKSNWSPDVALLGSVEDPILMPDPIPSSARTKSFGRPPNVTNPKEDRQTSKWSSTGSFILHSTRNLHDDMEVFSPLVDVQPIVQPLSSYMDGLDSKRSAAQSPPQEAAVTRADVETPQYKASDYLSFKRSAALDLSSRFSSLQGASSGPSSPTSRKHPEKTEDNKELENSFSLPVSGPCSPRLLGHSSKVSPRQENGTGSFSTPGSPRVPGHSSAAASPRQGASSAFALQLVQRALEESLGSVQRAIHEDVRNLHLDLLRQFHIQHDEMASAIQKLEAKQAEMMEEIKALRKENQQFRHLL